MEEKNNVAITNINLGPMEIISMVFSGPVKALLFCVLLIALVVLTNVVGSLGEKIIWSFSDSARLTFEHPISYWIGGHFAHFIKALIWFLALYLAVRLAYHTIQIKLTTSLHAGIAFGLAIVSLVLNLSITTLAHCPLWIPLGLLLAEALIWLFGYTQVPVIALREFSAMLLNPMGYVFIVAFSLLLYTLYRSAATTLSHITPQNPLAMAPLGAFLGGATIGIALLILIPAITMKLMAEEKASGTEEVLFTLPIKEWHVALGKFLGCFGYYTLLWSISWIQIDCISRMGNLDSGQVWSTYTALLVMGTGFIAMGLFASCLFKNQLPAFLVSFLGMLSCTLYIFIQKPSNASAHPHLLQVVLQYLSINTHLERATRGLVDSRTIFLFISMAAVFLFLAIRVMEIRRWGALNLKEKFRFWKLLLIVGGLLVVLLPTLWSLTFGVSQVIKPVLLTIALLIIFLTIISRVYNEGSSGRLVFGANVITASIAVIMIAVMFNYLAYRYHTVLDWSCNHSFTISTKARQTLLKVIPDGEHIRAIALVGFTEIPHDEMSVADNDRYMILQTEFRKFADSLNRPGNIRFEYEFVHPLLQKSRRDKLINKYGISGHREVLFLYRDRHHVLTDKELFQLKLEMERVRSLRLSWQRAYEQGYAPPPPKSDEELYNQIKDQVVPDLMSVYPAERIEEAITNAMLQAIKGTARRIYFTQNHKEKIIKSRVTEKDVKEEESSDTTAFILRDLLRRHNLDVAALTGDLAKEGVPPDCGTLVIMGPREKFSSDEIKQLEKYIENGGRLVVLLEPEHDGNLTSFLARYGIKTAANVAGTFQMDRMRRRPTTSHLLVLQPFQFEKGHFILDELFTPQRTQDGSRPFPDWPYAFKRVRSVEIDREKLKQISWRGFEFFKVPHRFTGKPIKKSGAEDDEGEVKKPPYGFAAFVQSKQDYLWEIIEQLQEKVKSKGQEERTALHQALTLLDDYRHSSSRVQANKIYQQLEDSIKRPRINHEKVRNLLQTLQRTLEKENDTQKWQPALKTIKKIRKLIGERNKYYEQISSFLVEIRGTYQFTSNRFKVRELKKVINQLLPQCQQFSNLLTELGKQIGSPGKRARLIVFGDTTFCSDEKCQEAAGPFTAPPPWLLVRNNRVILPIFLKYLAPHIEKVKIEPSELLLFRYRGTSLINDLLNLVPVLAGLFIGVLVWFIRRSF